MLQTTRTEIRKAFKLIGYRVQFKRLSFDENYTKLFFIDPETSKSVDNSSVFYSDYLDKHKNAFNLLNKYSKAFLTCTEQKIL